MKRHILIVLVAFFLEGCGALASGPAAVMPSVALEIQNTPSLADAQLPVEAPDPTIDYQAISDAAQATTVASQATAISAVQTSSAALAAQVQATNDHEAREFGVLQMTQDADHATWTAVPTVIPMTLTQQAISNTAVADAAKNVSAAFTATAEYPTQIVVIAKAENDAKMAPVRSFAEAINPLFTGLVLLVGFVLVIVVLRRWSYETAQAPNVDRNEALDDLLPQPKAPYTNITHIHEHNDDAETIRRILPPLCDPEVFREWAVYALGGESIAVDKWETKDSPFQGREYRDVFYPWVIENGLKINKADGMAVLSKRGIAYCKDWIIKHPLSPIANINPKTATSSSVGTESVNTDEQGSGLFKGKQP